MSPQATIMSELLAQRKIVTMSDARGAGVTSPVSAIGELLEAGHKVHADYRRGECVWSTMRSLPTQIQAKMLAVRTAPGTCANAGTTRFGRILWRCMADSQWRTIASMMDACNLEDSQVRDAIRRFKNSTVVRFTVNTRHHVGGTPNQLEYQIIRLGERA